MLRPLLLSEAVALVFEDVADLPLLFTDEGKVSQILRNFLSNAIKFTPAGEIRVWGDYDAASDCVTFSVRDTGIGIAPQQIDIIWQEFGQLENPLQKSLKGTGLGLPLSKKLSELLGGSLTVQSVPGAGSMFTLAIPAVLPLAEPSAPPQVAAPPRAEQGGVLVIDDEETSRYVLRQMLAGLPGLRILEADTGAQGLRRAVQEQPEVILLDLRMPGMDGFEVLDRLAASPDTRDIPVVVCTSSILESADRARPVKAHAVLSKAGLTRGSHGGGGDAAAGAGRRAGCRDGGLMNRRAPWS